MKFLWIPLVFAIVFFVLPMPSQAQETYTEEEARALIEEYGAREAAAKEKIDELRPQVEECKAKVRGLDIKIRKLEAQIADLKAKQPKTYIVKAGDTLRKIAEQFYGDGTKWMEIYKANKAVIKDPSYLYPGLELKIPVL